MKEVLYSFFLMGSVSAGYSLVRTAFPKIQLKKMTTKIILGYIFGFIIFGIPLTAIYLLGIDSSYFLGLGLILYTLIFIIMYAKRVLFKEIEIIQKVEEKKTAQIPSSILKKDAIERKIMFEKGLMVKSAGTKIMRPEEVKKQVFKEKDNTIIQSIDKKTKEMEKVETEVQKREALEKLRAIAKEISKKKPSELRKAESQDLVEEELLENLNDEK